MRLLGPLFLWLFLHALALSELVGPHARVLYPEGEDARARALLVRAEAAIKALSPELGPAQSPFLYRLAPGGPFNGFAQIYPEPGATLLDDFPYYDGLFLNNPDPLYTLVLHETVHLFHHQGKKLGLGLLLEGSARPYPAWLTEGLAVYFESKEGQGRLHHPATRGLLRALAKDPPPFWALGTAYTPYWPYGSARYLVGGAFVDYVARRVGLKALLRAGARYQRWPMPLALTDPTPFANAWRAANPKAPDLLALWRAFWRTIPAAGPAPGKRVARGKKPAPGPDGTLAYLDQAAIVVGDKRFLHPLNPTIGRLGWLNAKSLYFDRLRPLPDGRAVSALYTLDLQTGRTQLVALDARYPAATPTGGLCWVKQGRAEDRVFCQGQLRWTSPANTHVVGLAPGEPFALALWDRGRVRLGTLRGDAFIPLPTPAPLVLGLRRRQDALYFYAGGRGAQALAPVKQGSAGFRLVFETGRATFAAYRLDLKSKALALLATAPAGVLDPAPAQRALYYATPTPKGYEIRRLDRPWPRPAQAATSAPPRGPGLPELQARARPYDPLASLGPRGWWPLGLGVLVAGQDDSQEHAWTLAAGWPFFAFSYGYTPRFGLARYALGASFFATPELATGALAAGGRLPLEKGALDLGAEAGGRYAGGRALPFADVQLGYAIGYARGRERVWGAATEGLRVFAAGGWDRGPWWRLGLLARAGGLEAGLMAPGATFTLGPRFIFPLDLADEDGFSYLSHLALTPRLVWARSGGLGGEVELSAYAASVYYLPARLTLRVGYRERGGWYWALGPRY